MKKKTINSMIKPEKELIKILLRTKIPLLIIRIIVSIISIMSGLLFVSDFIYSTINNNIIAYSIAAALLLFIEIITVFTLLSAFSLLFQRRIGYAFLFLLIAAGAYSFSFNATTKGFGKWVRLQDEKHGIIKTSYKKEVLNLDSIFLPLINYHKKRVDSISDINKKYVSERHLQSQKLAYEIQQVEKYQKEFQLTKKQKKIGNNSAMNLATKQVAKTSQQYREVAIFTMIALFVFNFLAVLFPQAIEIEAARTIPSLEGITRKNNKNPPFSLFRRFYSHFFSQRKVSENNRKNRANKDITLNRKIIEIDKAFLAKYAKFIPLINNYLEDYSPRDIAKKLKKQFQKAPSKDTINKIKRIIQKHPEY